MAHVKVYYVEEVPYEENGEYFSCPEWFFIENDYKKVIWDGNRLTIGKKRIITENVSSYGKNDIEFLEIDGVVFRDVRPETLEKNRIESEKRIERLFQWAKENAEERRLNSGEIKGENRQDVPKPSRVCKGIGN